MTSFNKRVQQMIRQVLVFGEAHPELFEKESLTGRRGSGVMTRIRH